MIILILAGGSGTRLWPLSREFFAKQFIGFDSDDSLLQQAVKRANTHCNEVVIVTNETQYFLVKHQLEGFDILDENIVREPVGRNTGPAIALGCSHIKEKYGTTDILVMPSDHIIDDSFFNIIKKIENYSKDYLCTFGIKPTYPATGYGYIKTGDKKGEGYLVDEFIEKPDMEKAERFHSSNVYLWNSGIFFFNIEKLFNEYKKYLPKVYSHLSSKNELLENYKDLPSISIDYAIMEKVEDVLVFPYEGGWNDVGSFTGVYDILKKDRDLNAKIGDVLSLDTVGSLIWGEDRLIVTIGLKDLVLLDTKDALLVADKSRVEDVKKVVEILKEKKRDEVSLHATVYRPWGYYTVLEKGEQYKVKRLTLYSGKSISLQLHHHRAEHWIVVKGNARILKDGETVLVNKNESMYVPKLTRHRVENPGKEELHIIEIQTGEYMEEDDIERFVDEYGRA